MAADDTAPIIGRWVDRLPDGTAMITGFSAHTVTFYSVNAQGMSMGPPTTITVQYRKLSDGALLATPIGDIGEPLMVKVKNDIMVLTFEGLPPRTLMREKEVAIPKPHS
ncbi:MAG: hypothetical protein EXQ84_00370 [Rhodospirillaceae bacterium]|nr:hypothetical protein [Rhodospirillaceae bacterium]